MNRRKTQEAVRVTPDDFVPGHRALYADVKINGHRVYVRGKIKDVSPSGKTVVFECETAWCAFGLPIHSTWTWRGEHRGFFQKGTRPRKGDMGLLRLEGAA